MVVADLHVHTTNSDGTLTLGTLPGAAREAGVETVSVTDHDRVHPALDSPVVTLDGVRVVHGIELRVDSPAGRVDLLGYGVERTDALVAETRRLQDDRIERARAIVACVEDRLGVELDVTFEPGVGRPHIARAIADSSSHHDYGAAFTDLIGGDCPCYVPRDVPDFATGRDLLSAACDLVVLAHPFRYDDPVTALELTDSLDGVEGFYPYGHVVDQASLESVVRDRDLVVTGGSDAHEDRLGRAGLDREAYSRFQSNLDTPW